MSDDERTDFLWQLALACREEAPLWEIPRGSTDLIGNTSVLHGPWSAGDCSRVLTNWLDGGLLGLYRREGDAIVDVDHADARDLLCASDLWTLNNSPNLYVTDVGNSLTPDEWIVLASRP